MAERDGFIETLPSAYVRCDRNWTILEANNRACAYLGMPYEALIGQNGFAAMPAALGTPFEAFLLDVLAGGQRGEITAEFAPFNGIFHMIAHPEGEVIHVFFTDVTPLALERDRAEAKAAEIAALQTLLGVILEGLREGVVATDAKGEVIFANSASNDILGRSVVGDDEADRRADSRPLYEDHVTPVPESEAPLMRALRGENVDNVIQWIKTDTGQHEALVTISATPLTDQSGAISGAVAWFRDITEAHEQGRRLEASEARHKAQSALLTRVIDGLNEGLVVFDKDAKVLVANTYSRIFLGPDPEGGRRDDLVADYRQSEVKTGRIMQPDEYASALAMRGFPVFQRETLVSGGHLREDIILVESSVPLRDEAGEIDGAILWFRDVTAARKIETEREELRKRLAQAQKMEAVGQLAGGVAHDFNNLLTVILGNAEALIEETQDTPSLREFGEVTSAAALRAAELTHRLLAFSRQQPLEPKIINVATLVAGVEVLIKRSLGETIDLHVRPEPSLWTAIVDPGQLENAIINLAVNARDAMPDGGHLTIEASNVVLDDVYTRLHPEVKSGDYVSIAVTDTGSGMPPEVVERVFEPFFTTKEVGRGTGLGLSMVYGFIKQSGGHIRIYSEVGEGTTVTMLIPRANSGQAELSGKTRSGLVLPKGTERIAVVEDDLMVRSLIEIILAGLGYTVTAFENGPLLLAELDAGAAYDLLLTDVVLPGGMNGRVLAGEVAGRRPAMKVLYMSGYTENAIVHHGRLDEGIKLLHKPFQRVDLAGKVRAALDGD